jgi:4-diphosphocytidyl-2-C-methyl-D-erythritol kinase
MISFPNCKINLGLNVVERRKDGYHEIQSLMYPIPLEEVLEIIEIPGKGFCNFESTGLEIPGSRADNLCVKAYNLLNTDFNLPAVQIHLHKMIPMGGGLGGGSSDAAETIKTLNTIFDLSLSNDQMKSYAAQIGSDCAFFIENNPQYATGRGEILSPTPLTLKNKYLLLINDGTHIGTKEAYAGIQPKPAKFKLDTLHTLPLENWKEFVFNDFESSVFELYPHLKIIKKNLYDMGAIYASMSGSGASIFGIFNSIPKGFYKQDYGVNKVLLLKY